MRILVALKRYLDCDGHGPSLHVWKLLNLIVRCGRIDKAAWEKYRIVIPVIILHRI